MVYIANKAWKKWRTIENFDRETRATTAIPSAVSLWMVDCLYDRDAVDRVRQYNKGNVNHVTLDT